MQKGQLGSYSLCLKEMVWLGRDDGGRNWKKWNIYIGKMTYILTHEHQCMLFTNRFIVLETFSHLQK